MLPTHDHREFTGMPFDVAVVGLPSRQIFPCEGLHRNNSLLRSFGVGKSALCRRFVHGDTLPACTEPVENRLSSTAIVSDEKFHKNIRTLNGAHYRYHGSVGKELSQGFVQFRLFEDTMFMSDSLKPHPCASVDGDRDYVMRAPAEKLSSPAELSDPSAVDGHQQPFPSEFSVDAFVFVLDGTKQEKVVSLQLDLLVKLASRAASLGKPLAVAVTKCDILSDSLIAETERMVRSKVGNVPVCQLSAATGVGVDFVFARVHDETVSKSRTVPSPLPPSASTAAVRGLRDLLEQVKDFNVTWEQFVQTGRGSAEASLTAFACLHGEEECFNLFRERLIDLQAEHLRFSLREAVASHPDLKTMDIANVERSVFHSRLLGTSLAENITDGQEFSENGRLANGEGTWTKTFIEADRSNDTNIISTVAAPPEDEFSEEETADGYITRVASTPEHDPQRRSVPSVSPSTSKRQEYLVLSDSQPGEGSEDDYEEINEYLELLPPPVVKTRCNTDPLPDSSHIFRAGRQQASEHRPSRATCKSTRETNSESHLKSLQTWRKCEEHDLFYSVTQLRCSVELKGEECDGVYSDVCWMPPEYSPTNSPLKDDNDQKTIQSPPQPTPPREIQTSEASSLVEEKCSSQSALSPPPIRRRNITKPATLTSRQSCQNESSASHFQQILRTSFSEEEETSLVTNKTLSPANLDEEEDTSTGSDTFPILHHGKSHTFPSRDSSLPSTSPKPAPRLSSDSSSISEEKKLCLRRGQKLCRLRRQKGGGVESMSKRLQEEASNVMPPRSSENLVNKLVV